MRINHGSYMISAKNVQFPQKISCALVQQQIPFFHKKNVNQGMEIFLVRFLCFSGPGPEPTGVGPWIPVSSGQLDSIWI